MLFNYDLRRDALAFSCLRYKRVFACPYSVCLASRLLGFSMRLTQPGYSVFMFPLEMASSMYLPTFKYINREEAGLSA